MTPTRNGNPMSAFPAELDGAVIPGGCDTCNAEQRIVQIEPLLWSIGIARRIQASRRRPPDTFRP